MSEAKIVLSGVDQTKAAFDSVKKGLTDLQTKAVAVTGVLGTLGVTAYVAKLGSDVVHVIEQWDELGKAAQRAGFQSAQGLAEFQFAAKLSGVEAENFEVAVSKLSTKMAEAAGGSKEAAAVFKAMGLSIRDSNGQLKSTEDFLTEVAGKFSSYKDGPEKAALATELFSKAGRQMIPLLNGGAEGIEKLREEFRQLRGEISGDTVKAAEQFNDNITKLEANVGGLARTMAEKTLPGLLQITDAMVEQAKKGNTLLAVWAGLSEFFKIGTNTDSLGKKITGSAEADAALTVAGAKLSLLLQAQQSGGDSAPLRAEIAKVRTELEQLQAKALAASHAVKSALNPNYEVDPSYQTLENRRLAGDRRPSAPVTAKPTTGGTGAADEYAALLNRVRERLAAQTAEIAAGKALTDQQKFAIKVEDDLANSKHKLTDAQKSRVQGLLAESEASQRTLDRRAKQLAYDKAVFEEQQQQQAEADAAYVESGKARDQYRLAIDAETRSLTEAGEMLDLEGQLIGTNDRERKIAIENLRIELKLRQDLDALDRNLNFDEGQRDEERARLRTNAAIARTQAAQKVNQDAEQDFIGGFRDDMKGALQRAFEDGKNPGKAFIDAFASTLYTRVSAKLAEAITDGLLKKAAGAGIDLRAFFGGASSSGVNLGTATGNDLSLFYASAKGNVFQTPGLSDYSNRIVNRPTVFAFARGAGLMGEAGPEAVMPLRRGPDGRLGVEAGSRATGMSLTVHNHLVVGDVASMQQVQEQLRVSEQRTLAAVRRTQKYGREA
jgi:phage-related minor tail protein